MLTLTKLTKAQILPNMKKKTPQLDNWFPIAKTLGTDRAATPHTYVSNHIRKRRTSQVTKYGICLQLGTKHADSI